MKPDAAAGSPWLMAVKAPGGQPDQPCLAIIAGSAL
jgi:hypothetical protein